MGKSEYYVSIVAQLWIGRWIYKCPKCGKKYTNINDIKLAMATFYNTDALAAAMGLQA